VDWTEQRHHLAGRLGAALLSALCESGSLSRHPTSRTVELTDRGAAVLYDHLGVTPPSPAAT
jgi:hypothetical protein